MPTTTETQARATFAEADRKLQSAITAYSSARKALHAITGEFFGADDKALQQFSSRSAAATTQPTPAADVLTDC